MKRSIRPFLTLLVILPILAAPTAGAVHENGLSAFPASPDPMDEFGSVWFRYRIAGGQSRADSITVANDSATAKRVSVYPVDAAMTRSGTLAMRNQSEPRLGIGAWIKLSTSSLTLGPYEHRNLPFVMTVPRDAPIGDQVGGLIIQDESPSSVTTQHGVNIQVISRLGVRVYETVPGLAQLKLTINQFQSRPASRMHFTFTLTNSGNSTVQPKGSILVKGFFGFGREEIGLPPIILLPQRTATIQVESSHRRLLANIGRANLHLVYGGTNLTRAISYVWINPAAVMTILAIFVLGFAGRGIFQNYFIRLRYSSKKRNIERPK